MACLGLGSLLVQLGGGLIQIGFSCPVTPVASFNVLPQHCGFALLPLFVDMERFGKLRFTSQRMAFKIDLVSINLFMKSISPRSKLKWCVSTFC